MPADSKVLIVGMADGDFLYQFLHNRTHPFGRWRNDLTYANVYDWWNCLQVKTNVYKNWSVTVVLHKVHIYQNLCIPVAR